MNTREGPARWLEKRWNQFKNRKRSIDLSYSRVQAYHRCPWMYHLIYNEGWRSGPHAASSLGQSLHRGLAAYLAPENENRSLERLLEIYDEVWVNEGFSSTQETLDTYDKGRKILEQFFHLDQKRKSHVVATEMEFTTPVEGHIFRGTIDRLDLATDGTHEIIEYKTEGSHWNAHRIENDLQLTLYALGAKEGLKLSPIRLKYCFLSTGEYIETHRTPAQLSEARKLLMGVAKNIRREEFSPNSSYCSRCEFGQRCAFYVDNQNNSLTENDNKTLDH